MNYLLHNRREYYVHALPRIPDPGLRHRLSEIVARSMGEISVLPSPDSSNDLQKLHLEDSVKKAYLGEKRGKSVLSVAEFLERAIRFEELCCLYTSKEEAGIANQVYSYSIVTLGQLREFDDELRYHRIRLP